ncbi:MAG: UDP-glucose 4-epimerase GalE [Clostridia bacterium]|nr:UDP-glucose 4-epimerase GalE [Clostridia bacterium]MBO7503592.1 UDP-glucose 4-epimerase GalE [Clostridia bacterium]
MHILVSGGTGFIGSHTVVELLNTGCEVTVFDNLSNSKASVIGRIEKLTGKRPAFFKCDMNDRRGMNKVFSSAHFDAVIHFAGYKAVGESVEKPLMYYENNICGTLVLLDMMKKYGVENLIFSSSATVYGIPEKCPVTESSPLSTLNPYGRTKLMIEEILRDVAAADSSFSTVLLRYFNPVGCHASGLISEDPNGIPNNLMPRIIQAVRGQIPELTVYGDDYDTRDGTCIRDYIHVVDLAKGHVAALDYVTTHKGSVAVNLGTGNGCTVLELIKSFERVNNLKVPYSISGRREGDSPAVYADTSLAKELLGWNAELGIDDMCRDAWKGACMNG